MMEQTTDAREGVHDDERTAGPNNPPIHDRPTRGPARFLEWVGRQDRDPPLEELGDLFDDWRQRQDTRGQTTPGGENWRGSK